MKKTDWQTRSARLFCFAAYTAIAYLGIKYLLPVIFPLTVALLISFGVSSAARKISKATKLPTRLVAFLIITLSLAGIAAVLFFACRQLISEAKRMTDVISVNGTVAPALEYLERIPVLYRVVRTSEELAGSLAPVVSKLLTMLVSYLGGVLGGALKATPSALLGALVTVLFIYYASMDRDRIVSGLRSVLPKEWGDKLSRVRGTAIRVGMGYVRAYGLIFLLTFSEILVGLLILCPAYSLLGALFIAVVDILPVFGAGFVLIPWGIACLLSGQMLRGIGLLVLYVIVTVVRQIAEPHILGGSMGVHPLLTLTGMYLGYRFFGFSGMMIAPIAVCFGLAMMKSAE